MRFSAGMLAALACASLAAEAGAATISVNTVADVIADDGACSLREAVRTANVGFPAPPATPGEYAQGEEADVIKVPAGTYAISLIVVAGPR